MIESVPVSEHKEVLPVSDIALVRSLSAPPRVENGRILLQTPYQLSNAEDHASEHRIPSILMNFSLNGAGKDNDDDGYVVLADLKQTITDDPNVRLINLHGRNTYFEVAPDRPMRLPESATLIVPDVNQGGDPTFVDYPHVERYKASGFTDEEVRHVYDARSRIYRGSEEQRISSGREECLRGYLQQGTMKEIIQDFARHSSVNVNPYHPNEVLLKSDGSFIPGFEIFAAGRGISLDAGYSAYVQGLCRTMAKKETLDRILRSKGYRVFDSDDRLLMDSLSSTAKTMGVTSREHSRSIYAEFEEMIVRAADSPSEKRRLAFFIRNRNDKLTPYLKAMLTQYGYSVDRVSIQQDDLGRIQELVERTFDDLPHSLKRTLLAENTRGQCGTASGEYIERLKDTLPVELATADHANGSGHNYIVIPEPDPDDDIIIDRTAGQFIEGFSGLLFMRRKELRELILRSTVKNTRSKDVPSEAFERIWGKKSKIFASGQE